MLRTPGKGGTTSAGMGDRLGGVCVCEDVPTHSLSPSLSPATPDRWCPTIVPHKLTIPRFSSAPPPLATRNKSHSSDR